MRSYSEPSLRNLMRPPLVLGVSPFGLITLLFSDLAIFCVSGNTKFGAVVTLAIGAVGYISLRILEKFAVTGWEELLISKLEKRSNGSAQVANSLQHSIRAPELLTDSALLTENSSLEEELNTLKFGDEIVIVVESTDSGKTAQIYRRQTVEYSFVPLTAAKHCFTLKQLPTQTDPLSTLSILRGLPACATVVLRIQGLDSNKVKSQIEINRRRNFQDRNGLTDIDSEVSFSESSTILEGISRGDQNCAKFSFIILTDDDGWAANSQYFLRENSTKRQLAIRSISGERKRLHRSFVARTTTISDLVPHWGDSKPDRLPVLSSIRGGPVSFSPTDSRLDALHWLVVGASGSGKSFFTGVLLKRLIEADEKFSVVFIDHGRSFKRLVEFSGSKYFEPSDYSELSSNVDTLLTSLDQPSQLCGIELSELSIGEKKSAASKVLSEIELYLKRRTQYYPIYVVLDECWNFLRDEPVLVQRAFREYRKLNGAVIAITQSLSDFVTNETGQSILQNAPVRVLLRQGEDLTPFKGALNLNEVELQRTKLLTQKRGVFSECLIKTPFESYLARLYPTNDEHDLLRTDNLRHERFLKLQKQNLEDAC